jgi:hypothetical protein
VVHEIGWSRDIPLESEYCPLIIMQKSVWKDCNDVNAFVKHYWEGNISFILLHCLPKLSLYITLAIYQHCTCSICLKFLQLRAHTHTQTHIFLERERKIKTHDILIFDWEPIILTLLRNQTWRTILYYLYHAYSYN